MKRNYLSLILALVMLGSFAFIGCEGSDKEAEQMAAVNSAPDSGTETPYEGEYTACTYNIRFAVGGGVTYETITPILRIHNNFGKIYTIIWKNNTHENLADMETNFAFEYDQSSVHTWDWDATNQCYVPGGQTFRGWDTTITWGAIYVTPISDAAATIMNQRKLMGKEDWQGKVKVQVNGLFRLPPFGAKTLTVFGTFNEDPNNKTHFGNGDPQTSNNTFGIMMGFTPLYNAPYQVYPNITDDATQRKIGGFNKFYE